MALLLFTIGFGNIVHADSGVKACLGIGLQGGIRDGGGHIRLWFNDIVGLGVKGYTDYDLLGQGVLGELFYKPYFDLAVAPYIVLGGGYHNQEISFTVKQREFTDRIHMYTLAASLGFDIRLGKNKNHSIAVEGGYFFGRQKYPISESVLGSNSITKWDEEFVIQPYTAKLLYTFYFCKRDKDGDGIMDNDDRCPDDPEDFDNFEDSDGCPEVDNDRDGILDADDKCPLSPEDLDNFEDTDGCPENDNDQDGIFDTEDQCPNDPEDIDNFEDTDGCPDLDNDNDGIADTEDKCPIEPEDIDGFEDTDGCPDIDNDADGILDVNDRCPNEKEIFNQLDDADGCPDTVVQITKEPLILRGVNFETGKAILTAESSWILDKVLRSLEIYPEIKIEIQGHTDNVGSARSNRRLSWRRAQSVRKYFIERGINPGRLKAVGYGEDRPIATNLTADGRAENRRVELKAID